MARGVVTWFSRGFGYGFVETHDGQKARVLSPEIKDLRMFQEGQVVECSVETSPSGLMAKDVKIVASRVFAAANEDAFSLTGMRGH